jgi:cell division protein ZapA
MAQIDVTINGRSYRIACDDGQEDHILQLAEYVDKRVAELVSAVGQAGEARLLVMASLLIADELSEAFAELDARKDEAPKSAPGETVARAEASLAAATEALAARIEAIAARLEAA